MVDTALEGRASHELDHYEPIDTEYRILDVYAGGVADEDPRIEALATISAGTKNEKGIPVRSTDGRIYLHDLNVRAPGLQAALEQTAYRKLTIAFPSNDLSKVVQQRYACYSATALRAYGDEHAITVLEGGRRDYAAGTREYETWLKQCKVQASFYFCMAGWVDGEPIIDFPDGFGYYRLRTTSRNSLRSLLSTLQHIMRFTNGRIAGIPFELSIEQRDVATADGKRQKVPVWVMVMRPPGGLTLNSRTLQRINRQALAAGESLMLPAPSRETVEYAEVDTVYAIDDDTTYTEEDIAAIERGGLCDEDHWRKAWHATVKGTALATDDARHTFIARFTNGKHSSIRTFLSTASDADANALLVAVAEEIADSGSDHTDLLTDAEFTELLHADDPDGGHIRRNGATPDPKPMPEPAEEDELTIWVKDVRAEIARARTTADDIKMANSRDAAQIMNALTKMLGNSKRARALLTDLLGRDFSVALDLRSGEARIVNTLIVNDRERRRLERYANPQGALV